MVNNVMTEELDAVFFDLGGTLVDLSVRRETVWADVLAGRGLDVGLDALTSALRKADRDFDEAFAEIQGMDERPFWKAYDEAVIRTLGIDVEPDAVVADLSASFGRIIPDEGVWADYPDSKPMLDDLSKRDMKVGLISNATDLARRVLRRLDLDRYFDPIIISSEIGHRKPEREIFAKAVRDAGVAPSRALYIGDKLAVDVKGASGAGMNAVLIDRESVFPDAPCVRITSLSALQAFL
jgi:putative hydrolase of the HAD superfamily